MSDAIEAAMDVIVHAIACSESFGPNDMRSAIAAYHAALPSEHANLKQELSGFSPYSLGGLSLAAITALEAHRIEAQSACTAWQSVFLCIEAHLLDRIAMKDPASPQTYLDIIRSEVEEIDRFSKQIIASRWHDSARYQQQITALEARLADTDKQIVVESHRAAREYDRACRAEARLADAYERCARIAENACLVPPDGGSPTRGETDVAMSAASAIRAQAWATRRAKYGAHGHG